MTILTAEEAREKSNSKNDSLLLEIFEDYINPGIERGKYSISFIRDSEFPENLIERLKSLGYVVIIEEYVTTDDYSYDEYIKYEITITW